MFERYYVCSGYVTAGRTVCDALSIPCVYLDAAVLDGIQKRMESLLDRDRLARRLRRLLQAAQPAAASDIPALETRLADVRRRLDRAVQVVLTGPDDVPTLRAVLVGLERERVQLESQLAATRDPQGPAGDLNAIVGAILGELDDIRSVLSHDEPTERRELVRRFLAGIRIEKTTRQAVLSWYDVPRPSADSMRLVELRGDIGDGVRVETLALPRSGRARTLR